MPRFSELKNTIKEISNNLPSCENEEGFLPLATIGDFVCFDCPPHEGLKMQERVVIKMIEQVFCRVPTKYHNRVIFNMANPVPGEQSNVEQLGYVFWFYIPFFDCLMDNAP